MAATGIYVAVSLLTAGSLSAWEIDLSASTADLEDFHRQLSFAAYPFARHGAKPLGVTGVQVYADLAVNSELSGDLEDAVVDGNLTGDLLNTVRVGARKGLPGGIDLGLSFGRVMGLELDLWAAELQWALWDGGLVRPSVSFRLVGMLGSGNERYELEQYGLEALVSKRVAVATLFVGGGVTFSDGSLIAFSRPEKPDLSDTGEVLFGGVVLHLLILDLTAEMESGETTQVALRVGFGF